ncbi:MAG: hypothetical protein VYD81_05520 [Planctomycetota bacterium]|nr:hypothetical protein [Planctomycetota bacterium]
MVRLFAAVLGLSVCLVAVLGTSPVAFGGGPDPAAILCPEDLASRVAVLEGLLSVANASLDTAAADNAAMTADLVTVRAELEAADAALARCRTGTDPVVDPGSEVEN